MRDTVCDLDVLKARRSTVDKATLHSSSLRGASEGMRHVALPTLRSMHIRTRKPLAATLGGQPCANASAQVEALESIEER